MSVCACGRMDKPFWLLLCRCCILEKEVGYAVSELQRGGEWPDRALQRLKGLIHS